MSAGPRQDSGNSTGTEKNDAVVDRAATRSGQPWQLSAARLTAVGRGAVATIRVCIGPSSPEADAETSATLLSILDSLFLAANGRAISEQPLTRIVFGRWGRTDPEELVICRMTVDAIEIHCHGGEAAVQRVLADLSDADIQVVDWREQVTERQGMIEAECLDVLSRTSTWNTTRIALDQASGLLKEAFLKLHTASLQNEIEFTKQLDRLLRWANFGLHLSTPWNVVLTGRPNVGKSSLMNALLGYQRAIVFDQPGTTRDVVTGDTAFDGWPFILSDTAGIRENVEGLEAAGIERAREQLQTADLRLLLVDLSEPPTIEDDRLIREWPDALIVGHKADQPNRWNDRLPDDAVLVSSLTGTGLEELQRRLVDRLVPSVPEPGTAIPVTMRQIESLKQMQSARTAAEREHAIEELLGHEVNAAPASMSAVRVTPQ